MSFKPGSTFSSDKVFQFLYNFFKDSDGSISKNDKKIIPINPVFATIIPATDIKITTASMEDNNINFLTSSDMNPSPNYYFMNAIINVTILKWSPMLLMYFTTKNPTTKFSPTLCNSIYNNNGQMIVPSICLEQSCNIKNNTLCVQDTKKYCGITYTPPQFIHKNDDILVNSLNANCKCFNTSLIPPELKYNTDAQKYAMCFSNECSSGQLDKFRITTNDCLEGCKDVDNWLHSSNPRINSERVDSLNKSKFDTICGANYKSPYVQPIVNTFVVISAIVVLSILSIELSHMTFQLKYKITIFMIVLLFFIYLSRDLSGKGMCSHDNKNKPTYICKSMLSNIKIPKTFCQGSELPCECIGILGDCPSGCKCINSVCRSKSGKIRTTKTQTYKELNLTGIIIGIIGIIIGISLLFTYHSHGIYKLIILILMVIPLIYAIVTSFIIKQRTVLGPCK